MAYVHVGSSLNAWPEMQTNDLINWMKLSFPLPHSCVLRVFISADLISVTNAFQQCHLQVRE